MKLRNVLLASAMMALPMVTANAQPVTGLYVGAGLGANFMQRETFKGPVGGNGNMRVDIGPAAVVSLGYGFGNGFRAEIEGNYRQNNGMNNPSGYGYPASGGGQEQKAGGMVNVLYDFVGLVPMVQPYIGAGVGYEAVIEQGLHVTGGVPAFTAPSFAGPNRTKGSFAYQAILGAAMPIPGMPGLSLTAEYRFMGLAGTRNYPLAGGAPGSIAATNDYNHAVLIGMRYEFGVAPPPAPAPMPVADMGAKTFLVFFDWDKADLTSRGEAIVKDAATYSTHTQYTRIDVDGNTDTSGTPQYNMGLSERRAHVVAGELVRDGVPQSAISMHAYGETKLLVPTGDGVREPQNRRVEIVFH
jgi:outer membrane protein OmpA-like peptidoglycan-associated protein/outer membrane protein W